MAEIKLTYEDNAKSVEAQVGDLIIIELGETPTTGYGWAVEQVDEQFIALQSSDFVPPSQNLIGDRGWRTFTFQAKKAGITTIVLKLWRHWVGERSIINRFNLTLQIRE